MLQKLPWRDRRFTALLGLLAALCLQYGIALPAGSMVYSNSWLPLAVFAAYTVGIQHLTAAPAWQERCGRYLPVSFAFGTLFALALVLGAQCETAGCIDYAAWLRWLAVPALGLAFTPCLAWLMVKVEAGGGTATEAAVGRRYFFKVWLVLILAYTVVLLAAWPGFFAYDARTECDMLIEDYYSGIHPLAHVLLLGGAVVKLGVGVLGSYDAGISIYLGLQMLVISAIFACVLYTLRRLGVRRWVCGLGLAYMALFPTVTMFAVCTTKDVLFSAGLVLLTTLLLVCAKGPDDFWAQRSNVILFALASVLVVLFRNNGIYAWVLFCIPLAAVYRRWWRRWLPALAAVLVLFLGVNEGIRRMIGARSGEVKEMLSVPVQQMARVYNEAPETFTGPERTWLLTLIPEENLKAYLPKLADEVKNGMSNDVFKSDPRTFLHVWVKAGLRRPDLYLDAFLMNTYQYWYPDTVVDGYVPRDFYQATAYFEPHAERPSAQRSFIPPLAEFYRKIGLEFYVQRVPVLATLFTPAFWLWAWLFAGAYLWARRGSRKLLALVPMALVFCTVLLGPIALVRYVLYFFFGVPLLLALLLDGGALLPQTTGTEGRHKK